MKPSDQVSWQYGPVPIIDPDYLTQVFASLADLAFVISPTGMVLSILLDSSSIEHRRVAHWAGQQMQSFLTSESLPKFEAELAAIANDGPSKKQVELNHSDGQDWPYPVRYTFHPAGPNNAVMMLGQNLRIVAETQDQLMQAQIALERGYEERKQFDARYQYLMANATDPFLFVSVEDGRVRDINPAGARLLGSSVENVLGNPVVQHFKTRKQGEFVDTAFRIAGTGLGAEFKAETTGTNHMITVKPMVFRVGGERMLACRLVPSYATKSSGDYFSSELNALFHNAAEGIVISDGRGVIKEVNDAFLEMLDIAVPAEVKGRSLADFLQRGQIDLNVMKDNSLRSGRLRIYSTRLINAMGPRMAAEVSAVHLNGEVTPAIGFVFRDADRAEAIRKATQPSNLPGAPNQSVVELVGSASLKEIVSETSELIEKMCIETAVELTSNNRAAAAELLGLSRQSLYVKLRKFGLLNKE